jgi:hypothetical protein
VNKYETASIDCEYHNKNADKIKQSMQHATTVNVTHVSYSRGRRLQKIQKLLSLWGDDLKIKTTAC